MYTTTRRNRNRTPHVRTQSDPPNTTAGADLPPPAACEQPADLSTCDRAASSGCAAAAATASPPPHARRAAAARPSTFCPSASAGRARSRRASFSEFRRQYYDRGLRSKGDAVKASAAAAAGRRGHLCVRTAHTIARSSCVPPAGSIVHVVIDLVHRAPSRTSFDLFRWASSRFEHPDAEGFATRVLKTLGYTLACVDFLSSTLARLDGAHTW